MLFGSALQFSQNTFPSRCPAENQLEISAAIKFTSAVGLKINEGPLKCPFSDFEKLSISESSQRGIGWCPSKKTVDATEEWLAEKIQENPDFKGFKKKGIEPRLNELICQMFSGIVAIGENAWAPSSGVLPSGVPMGDDTLNEGFGD
ncbi:hypothetical protein J1N35_022161 [Gossypium stocksii]|uniref:Uncharacterized protein n=1 Tax=Gossypium stocksii TaxID=47602 RepID=A0A9D3VFJ9_9ROSI|nr:hypothetical protein J1N35_022161 [Gossypium stocksii]